MATAAEIQSLIAAKTQEIAQLREEARALRAASDDASSAAERRRANLIASGLDPAADQEYQRLAGESARLRNASQNASNRISQAERELGSLQNQLRSAEYDERQLKRAAGSTSAGTTVREDSAAAGDPQPVQKLEPDGRITSTTNTTRNTNALRPDVGPAGGRSPDLPAKTINQTQATSGVSNVGSVKPASSGNVVATTQGGVGSGKEDTARSNTTKQAIEARFTETVKPQPNILDKYFSYSYVAELRMVKPEDYLRLIRNRKFNFDNSGILIRSGGAKLGSVNNYEQKRNQFFDLDFYIDNIVIENAIIGGATGSSHNYTSLSFTVTEPNGISFIDRLYAAVKQYIGIENYSAVVYVLMIKFYGYNEKGELEVVNNGGANLGDVNAIVTKIIPFTINDIAFSINNSLVTYQVTGSAIMHNIAASTDRGTITRNFEVNGATVREVLGGTVPTTSSVANTDNRVATTALPGIVVNFNQFGSFAPAVAQPSSSAPPTAATSSAASASLTNNLFTAINEEQTKRVKAGEFEFPDRYSIEFAEQAIASAKVNTKGTPALDKTPMSNNDSSRSNLPETQAADRNRKVLGIAAGTQIVQAIDSIIRNSSFILDQSAIIYDPVTDQPIPDPDSTKTFSWFKINMQAVPREYDKKRNDYAYDIKYVISLFEIKGMDSPYFPQGRFSGVHKSYPYWFTGQNTAVLNYQQTYNYAYSVTMSGAGVQQAQTSTSDLQKIRKYSFAPRSGQSAQGADGRTFEPSANAAEYLYDQAALSTVQLRIIGDPAWMQQGEIFPGPSATQFDYAPFTPDGTINFDASEILFEIKWVKTADYDLNSGLIKTDPNRLGPSNPNLQSLVYTATNVKNFFNGGKFEQELSGSLYIFEIPATAKINPVVDDFVPSNVNFATLKAPSPFTNSILQTPPFNPNNSGTGLNLNILQGFIDNVSLGQLTNQNVPNPPTTGSGLTIGSNFIQNQRLQTLTTQGLQLMRKEF
jgi:hypothetical protein